MYTTVYMRRKYKVPVIEFRNSWIYNIQWKRPKELRKPPSEKEWNRREHRLRQLWSKHGNKILRNMSRVTGLVWQEERIIVYLSWGIYPFSDPVTINLRSDVFSVFETLTHECIHRIASHEKNWKKISRRWLAFTSKYPKDKPNAINHVPIHAVHEVLWRSLFPHRVQAIKKAVAAQAYVRAWSIVDEVGAEEVIRRVFKKKPRTHI